MSNDVETNVQFDSSKMTEQIQCEGKRKFLLTEQNFQRLKDLQQKIYEATELSPSMRKLVNALVTDESISNLGSKLIEQLELM